jgi:hypothetical protein
MALSRALHSNVLKVFVPEANHGVPLLHQVSETNPITSTCLMNLNRFIGFRVIRQVHPVNVADQVPLGAKRACAPVVRTAVGSDPFVHSLAMVLQ